MAAQKKLWTRSFGARVAMSLSAVVAYVLLFFPAYTLLDRSAIVLAVGPLFVVALLFELWGGLAIGLGLIPLDIVLYLLVEGPTATMPGTDFWLVHVVLLATGLLVGHMRDRRRRLEQQLSERQVAECVLQESEAKYRNVVEQANDGIVIVQDGRMCYVSRQMADMLGLEVADLLDHPFEPFIVPEHRALVRERYVRRQRGEQVPSRYESAFICADGSHIDVEINAGVMDYEGRPATLAVVRDMTVRKAAERELRESEERLRTLIENIPVIFWSMDASRRYVMQNSQNREIYGSTEGLRLDEIPQDERLRQMWAEENERVFAGERVHTRYSHLVEGQERVYEGVVVPVRVGDQIVAIEGVHWDVTERQEAEQTLRAYQEQLEGQNADLRKLLQAVEQSANAVVITDLNGQIEYANPRFAEMTGYSVDEVLGQNPRVLQSGEHDQEYYQQLWDTILSGKAWRGEFRNMRKDGSLYWEEATIAPVYDETGTITHFVAIKEDITDRKEAADRLAERLRFEALLSELSAAFTGSTSDQFEVEISRWMQRVSESLGVDRSDLYRFDEDHLYAEPVYVYSSTGAAPSAFTVSRKELPRIFELVASGKVFVASTFEDLPVDAVEERTFLETKGIHAFLVVPLQAGGMILGALVFSSLKPQRNWPEDLIQRLRLVGEVLANALLRQQTEARLQRYAERLEVQHRLDQAILEAESAKATAQAALSHLSRVVHSRQSCVIEIDTAEKRASCLVMRRRDGTFEHPAALSVSLAGVALGKLTDGQVLRTDDSAGVEIGVVLHQLLEQYATGQCLVVPLRVQGRLVGTMNLEISVSDPFVEADLDVFREVADSLAIALHQARLHEQMQLDAQVKANLLQEVNHRVSNNLTAIIGLMRAERRYARSQNRATVEAMVERLTQRVEGMVAVHRLLSQSQWMPVRLDRLAEQVVGAALGILANEQSVEVVVEASDVRVSPRQASNLAMILNELTTNTIKHAMTGRAGGRIEVRISGEERIQLEYRDDGPAYPDSVLALEQTDVGLYLVQQLVLGLPGRLELRNEDGAVAAIAFEGEERDRT